MKRLAAVLTALILLAVPCLTMAQTNGVTVRYVYTENGKTLNIRSYAGPNASVIGSLPFGSQVGVVKNLGNGWTEIIWGSGYAYVMSRFLVNENPGSSPRRIDPVPTPPSEGDTVADLNREFRSARVVQTPYTVISRPVRASGWVNLRWAPSLEAELIETCPQGKELTVLTEMNNWYQVQDPTTGMIGFIMRKYVQVR